MKIKSNLVALAALGVALAAPFQALAAITPAKTNNVMSLNFVLTAWPNATATPDWLAIRQAAGLDAAENTDVSATVPQTATGVPFSIKTRDIINSLNGVTNNGVVMHFSSTAQLLFRQILSPEVILTNSLGTNRQIVVRDGTISHQTNTDVSGFFSASADYVSSRSVATGEETHKLASLSFNSPGHLGLSFTALVVEETGVAKVNGVSVVRSMAWNLEGVGEATNSTPNWIVGGSLATGVGMVE